jgi:hypothetical protein
MNTYKSLATHNKRCIHLIFLSVMLLNCFNKFEKVTAKVIDKKKGKTLFCRFFKKFLKSESVS